MLDEIAVFIQLVEVGSFSQLAKLLDSTQATVSRRIQNLEASIGLTLLKRDQRGLEVTPEGKAFYDQLKPIVAAAKLSWQNVCDQFQTNAQSILRLALTTETAKDLLLSQIPNFLKQHPLVKLHLTFTTEPIHLIKQPYDIALSSQLPNSPSHKVKLLRKFAFKLYGSPKYVAKYGSPQSLPDLLNHRCIGSLAFNGEEQNNYLVQSGGSGQVIQYVSNLYMDTTSHALEMAKTGEYLTGAWPELVQEALARGELVPLMPDFVFWELPCYLIRNNERSSQLVQALADFIEEVFKV